VALLFLWKLHFCIW